MSLVLQSSMSQVIVRRCQITGKKSDIVNKKYHNPKPYSELQKG